MLHFAKLFCNLQCLETRRRGNSWHPLQKSWAFPNNPQTVQGSLRHARRVCILLSRFWHYHFLSNCLSWVCRTHPLLRTQVPFLRHLITLPNLPCKTSASWVPWNPSCPLSFFFSEALCRLPLSKYQPGTSASFPVTGPTLFVVFFFFAKANNKFDEALYLGHMDIPHFLRSKSCQVEFLGGHWDLWTFFQDGAAFQVSPTALLWGLGSLIILKVLGQSDMFVFWGCFRRTSEKVLWGSPNYSLHCVPLSFCSLHHPAEKNQSCRRCWEVFGFICWI